MTLPDTLDGFAFLRLDGDPGAPKRVIRLCGAHDEPLPSLKKDVCLISVGVDDWFARLSPWQAPPAFGTEPFTGGGPETLSLLTDTLLPLPAGIVPRLRRTIPAGRLLPRGTLLPVGRL